MVACGTKEVSGVVKILLLAGATVRSGGIEGGIEKVPL